MSRLRNAAWFGRWGRGAAVAGLLALAGAAQAQLPELARPVRLLPGPHPLDEILADLSRQSGLLFSYSSSRLTLTRPYTGQPGPARPLRVVLAEVLATEGISYGLLDGQLILWPATTASPGGVTVLSAALTTPAPAAPLRFSMARVGSRPVAASNHRKPIAPGAALPARVGPMYGAADVGLLPATSGPEFSQYKPAARSLVKYAAQRRSAPTPHPAAFLNAEPKARLATTSPLSRHKAALADAVAAPPAWAGSQAASRRLPKASFPLNYLTGPPLRKAMASKVHSQPPPVANVLIAVLEPLCVAAAGGSESADALAARFSRPGPLSLPVVLTGRLFPAVPTPVVLPPAGPSVLARLAAHVYLHGEAWASGTLPLHALAKVGISRAYVVLGAATGPFDRRTGVAWGVGVGTTGPAWGRFTTSLDLVQWVLPTDGDDGITRARLFQLRPVLAYSLKAGGRLQVVGGPTLNLATARRNTQRTHWEFADNRWTWLESSDDGTLLRLWPGVQLGLRF